MKISENLQFYADKGNRHEVIHLNSLKFQSAFGDGPLIGFFNVVLHDSEIFSICRIKYICYFS